MLPIHLACYKSSRPSDRENLQHIYFRKGLVLASNGDLLVVMPAQRLLGDLFDPNEDFAVHAEDWKAGKMDKAVFMDRDGDTFTARDKNARVIGQCKPKKLAGAAFTMPNMAAIWPAQKADDLIASFAINASFITTVAQATGCNRMAFRKSENPKHALSIQCLSAGNDVSAYALMMPLLLKDATEVVSRCWDAFNDFFPELEFSADAEYVPVFGAETPAIPGFAPAETSVANEADDLL